MHAMDRGLAGVVLMVRREVTAKSFVVGVSVWIGHRAANVPKRGAVSGAAVKMVAGLAVMHPGLPGPVIRPIRQALPKPAPPTLFDLSLAPGVRVNRPPSRHARRACFFMRTTVPILSIVHRPPSSHSPN
jgi:hypothetical protein